MTRRKRQTDLQVLLSLPWPLTAALAVGSFVLLRWVAPSTFKGTVAIAFTPFFHVLAWLFLVGIGLIAAIAFARSRSGAALGSASRVEPRVAPTSQLDDTWREAIDAARTSADRQHVDQRAAPPTEWSIDVLRRMEWKQFELVAAAYYGRLGFRVETIRCGADGGIDIKLFRGESAQAISLVQCKAWTSRPVGVKPVRELLGVMVNEKVAAGVFLTTSTFTSEAVAFAEGNKLVLVDGQQFLEKIWALPGDGAADLLRLATSGAWTTPSCPSCGIKMVAREGKDRPFWGCSNFPRCRQTFVMAGNA